MKASTKRKEGGRRWRNDLLVEVTSFATLKTSSSCTSCGLLLVFGFIPLSKVHWFWFGFIFGLIHELENKNKKGNITCLPSASRLLEFPRILFSRCSSRFSSFGPCFLSEAQERGLERMEGRGLGDLFKNVSLCICCFFVFYMSEFFFSADAEGQTNALVSKKSELRIEAWMRFQRMISDGKGIGDVSQ